VLAGCGWAGCLFEPGDSCPVPTAEMAMVATVLDNGTTVRAEVDFDSEDRGGAGFSLELCDDDVLTINGQDPEFREKSNRFEYSVTVDAASAARSWVFRLERGNDNPSIEAKVELPPTFQVTSPVASQELSRAADFEFRWDPPQPGSLMQFELEEDIGGGMCILVDGAEHDYKRRGGVQVDDIGSWVVGAGSLGATEPDAFCNVRYKLSRIADGAYPDGLRQGGLLEAQVLRTLPLVSAP
jgi:hypothetical protein